MPHITAHYTTFPKLGQPVMDTGAIALMSGRPVSEVARWGGVLPESAKIIAAARFKDAARKINSKNTPYVLALLAIDERATLVVDGDVWVLNGILVSGSTMFVTDIQ